jgi:cell wall-active antibiotic response 4TMS protein YvqF
MRYTYRYRSFFWPAILILAGVIALLINTGQIPVERLGLLFDLWPLILIVIGIELILRRTMHGPAGDVAAALIVVLAIVAAAGYVTIAPNPAATRTFEANAELGNASKMTLSVNVGSANITIADTAPTGDLYRAHIEYNGSTPHVGIDTDSNTLEIDQRDQSNFAVFRGRKFALALQISSSVAWAIEVNSGAATIKMTLPNTHVTSLSFNTGASTDDVTLGTPDAVVPVEFNSGAVTVRLHRPSGTPASVEVSGAGLNVTVDGQSHHAIGHVTATQDLGSAGYDVRVNGAACNVTVDTTTPSG